MYATCVCVGACVFTFVYTNGVCVCICMHMYVYHHQISVGDSKRKMCSKIFLIHLNSFFQILLGARVVSESL